MGIKVIIILVCASLVESLKPPLLVNNFGLSNETVDVVNKIIVNQENTMKELYHRGFERFLKICSDVKKQLFTDCVYEPDDYSSEIAAALVSIQKGFKISLNTIPIALEKRCPAVEDARKPIHDDLDDVSEYLTAALGVAVSGSDCGNQSAMKVYQDAVKMKLKKSCRRVYNSTRECLNTTDSDTLAVIEEAQNGSVKGFNIVSNGVFHACKAIWFAVCNKTVDTKLEGDIKDGSNMTRAGLEYFKWNIFSLCKTFVLRRHLNPSVSIRVLAANQYGLTKSTDEYRAGNAVFMGSLEEIFRGGFMECNECSPINHSLSEMIRYYDAGDISLLVAANASNCNAAAAVAVVQPSLLAIAVGACTFFYQILCSVLAPCTNYSNSLAELEASEAEVVTTASTYSDLFLFPYILNRTFDNATTAALAKDRDQTINGGVNNTVPFFSGMKYLLNTTCTGQVIKGIFCILESLLDIANIGVDEFCQGISAYGIKTVQNSPPNSVNCSCT